MARFFSHRDFRGALLGPSREGAKLGVWRLAEHREGQVSLVRAALCAAKAVHRAAVHPKKSS